MRSGIAVIVFVTLALVPRAARSGPLDVWGTDLLASQGAPTGDFVSLAAGGALQTLAIRSDGTLYLSGGNTGLIPAIPSTVAGLPFQAVGMGRNHALAIRPDGSIVTWGLYSARCGNNPTICDAPTTGQFVAVTGGSNHSVALDTLGHVVVWGANGTPAPTGVEFVAIAARQNYTLALSADGNIYGWGVDPGIFVSAWTKDGFGHFIAPQDGNRYTAIAAGLASTPPSGLIVALRADGSVRVWDPSGHVGDAPKGTVFTQVAAGLGYAVGIDQAGQLHVWGDSAPTAFTAVPAGSYTAVAAATGHVTAIAAVCTMPATDGSTTSWNKFSIPVGTAPVVWVHAQFKPIDVPTAMTSRVFFTGVSFVLNGISYPMPEGQVTFDPAAPLTSTTTYDAFNGRWRTTINPGSISDENFVVGVVLPVDAAIARGGQATVRFTTETSNSDVSFSWKWSAAAYTYWSSDWNAALIQPYHGTGPTGSQHADTPDNTQIQGSLIQGPRGGGGSNYTGSWSASYNVAACP
jgi:hypothetical protein